MKKKAEEKEKAVPFIYKFKISKFSWIDLKSSWQIRTSITMPRPVMFDCQSSNQGKELMEKELMAKENWIRKNRNQVWQQALGPIQGRIQDICQDKTE